MILEHSYDEEECLFKIVNGLNDYIGLGGVISTDYIFCSYHLFNYATVCYASRFILGFRKFFWLNNHRILTMAFSGDR